MSLPLSQHVSYESKSIIEILMIICRLIFIESILCIAECGLMEEVISNCDNFVAQVNNWMRK